jgi:hypothetical protein
MTATSRPVQGVDTGRSMQRLDSADIAVSSPIGYEAETALPNCKLQVKYDNFHICWLVINCQM